MFSKNPKKQRGNEVVAKGTINDTTKNTVDAETKSPRVTAVSSGRADEVREKRLINAMHADFQISPETLATFRIICVEISKRNNELQQDIARQFNNIDEKLKLRKPVNQQENGIAFLNVLQVFKTIRQMKTAKSDIIADDHLRQLELLLKTVSETCPGIFSKEEIGELSKLTKSKDIKPQFQAALDDFVSKLKHSIETNVADRVTEKYKDIDSTIEFLKKHDGKDYFDFNELRSLIKQMLEHHRDMFVTERDSELSWKDREFSMNQEMIFFDSILKEFQFYDMNSEYHKFMYYYTNFLRNEFSQMTRANKNANEENISNITSVRNDIGFVITFLVLLDQAQFFYDVRHNSTFSSKANSQFIGDFAKALREELTKNPKPIVALKKLCDALNSRAASAGGVVQYIDKLINEPDYNHSDRILALLAVYVMKNSNLPKDELKPYAGLLNALKLLNVPNGYKKEHTKKSDIKGGESKSSQPQKETDTALVAAFVNLHAPKTPHIGKRLSYQLGRVFGISGQDKQSGDAGQVSPSQQPEGSQINKNRK